jgi:glycosyltransferase involved in cell wall biosynthesis
MMKIAFVNQPIDTIIPPNQNSVGACTYWVARPLAESAKILVYGLMDNHGDPASESRESGIEFRFFTATRRDKWLFNLLRKRAKLSRRSAPISTSCWLFPDYGRKVAADLKRQACDVIHLQHCSQYAPIIRAANPSSKIVLHLHSEWFSQSSPGALARRLRAVDLVTAVGGYVTNKTRQAFPAIADRCETTYNGIDVQEFLKEYDYSQSSRRKVKRILYTGAVSPHKGLHVLLDAFVRVEQQYPDVALDIVGPIGNYPIQENFDVRDREAIRRVAPFYGNGLWGAIKSKILSSDKSTYLTHLQAQLSGDVAAKVSFLGMLQRSELVNRYYEADIFAFAPVWDEGFGLPAVEAMAAGLPVVSSRSGTLVETVLDGKTGILTEKNDPLKMAEALLRLLRDDDLREAMGRAGRQRVMGQFTWDRIAKEMYSRYSTLLAGERSLTEREYSPQIGQSLPI